MLTLVSSHHDDAKLLPASGSPPHELAAAYRVVHVLPNSQPYARLYLCEQRKSPELVVVKHAYYDATRLPTIRLRGITGLDQVHEENQEVHEENQEEATLPASIRKLADSIQQEIHVARLLQTHPHLNVVRIIETQAHDHSSVAVVMAYYPSGDLFSLLEQQPTHSFTEVDALPIFRQIVAGVAHLHSLGIAPRDISLENVLIGADGHAAICDFGLSADVTTRCHECVGKMQYMAPEVAAASGEDPLTSGYDPELADVWSLGIVLFILLTGSPLFASPVPADPAWRAVERVGVAGILAQWGVADRISSGTMELLTQLLQMNPARRLQSVRAIRERSEAVYSSA